MHTTVAVCPGAGGLPRVELAAQDGSRAEIYLQGAHVTSWVPAGRQEALFLSRASEFRPGAPIRGGIPIVFPQFGTLGSLPLHGFARLMNWEFAGAQDVGDRAQAAFHLRDTGESRKLWPHVFQAKLTVTVGGDRMEVRFAVTNTGGEAFDFTSSFHTYLRVSQLAETRVYGLDGLRYRDAAAGGVEKQEESPHVAFGGEINRIYFHAPGEAELVEPGQRIRIQKTGFTDTVVWNPGAVKCAAMPDLEPDDYRRFVCVEAAAVGVPAHLEPRESWIGAQALFV